ncbi:Pkinase-domain-containing protein [Ramaria rubella]|nr:Pkinase-domain-containing protein [Ramaria rubella]
MPRINAPLPARHTPTLYAHAEDDTVEMEDGDQWSTAMRHTPSTGLTSPQNSSRPKSKLKPNASYPSALSPSPSSSGPDAPSIGSAPVYSDIYSKFVQRFRQTDTTDDYLRDDPDSHYFQRGLGQLVDGGDSEDEDLASNRVVSGSGIDPHEGFSPIPEPESLDTVTPQERERLEWQIMLASVLDGDVLKSEKTRIAVALDASVEHNRQLDIWLGIRARLRRRSESEEKRRLTERRLRAVDPIVTEILSFRFEDNAGETDPASRSMSATNLVGGLLNRLEAAQSLYPSLKAMYADKPTTTEAEFQARCDALIAWDNIDRRLRRQVHFLRKWTGSDTLDVTQPNTTAELPIGLHPHRPPVSSPKGPTDHADPSTFVERVLKEVSLQEAFEKGSLTTLHTLLSQSRATLIYHAAMFRKMNLPGFEKELVQIGSLPSRLMEASIHVRLDYAYKVKDPEVLIIDQLLEDFKVSIGLACTVKKEYQRLLAPVPEGNWQLPRCIPVTYDDAILDALRFFFKLIHWKLKSGTKGIYFKETDVLEAQANVFTEVSTATEEGSLLVAEQLCSLTNRLMIRVTDYFETQLHVPSMKRRPKDDQLPLGSEPLLFVENGFHWDETIASGRAKEMTDVQTVGWFSKVLDSVRLRYRKLQRYVRVLTQRYSNSAEYSLEGVNLERFISALVATDHFLVYTECFEEEGTYLVASANLRDRPESIKRMLQKAYHTKSELVPQSASGLNPGNRMKIEEHIENPSEEEESIGYLLFLSPTEQFLWHGLVLMLEVPMVDLDLKDKRIRLVADGGHDRLVKAKQIFADLFYVDDDDMVDVQNPIGTLRCITEQQAHLPSVNRELRKIVRATNRLAESIVNSVHHVRHALTGVDRCQELLENWFSFASEHGQHVQKHMDRATWIRFNQLLTRLAISWVAFICDDCDPTDRRTFRWAVIALEFTLLQTRHNNILHLPEDQFSLLRQKVASCMTLLISHFDILGARSSYEAKKEMERQEEVQRQQALEARDDDDEAWLASGSEEGKVAKGPQFATSRSVRLFWEDAIHTLRELESRRMDVEADQRMIGRVLDNEKPEDRSLVFLASSSSNISIRWQQGRFIGAGAFGSVYLAVNLDSGSLMAVKEIRYQDVSPLPNLYTQIREELQVMEMLHHPNVVEYYGIEVHRDKIYIFEEYCQGGSLATLLEYGRIEDEGIIQVYTMQMLEGLAYLHSKGIVHRDIKPDNILLDHLGVIKFVDFGAAKVLAKNQRTIQRSRVAQPTNVPGMPPGMANNSLTGTPMYMSPEVIKNDKRGRHGAMDIWSMGCVVLEFATGRKPWSNLDNEWAIMFHIGVATQHPPLPEPDQLSELGISFIKQCLTIDPMRRPTAVELMDHPWMVLFREVLEDYQEEANMTVGQPPEAEFERASVARQAARMHDQEVAEIASPTLSDLDVSTFKPPMCLSEQVGRLQTEL